MDKKDIFHSNEMIRIQQCVDSMCNSIKDLSMACHYLQESVKGLLPKDKKPMPELLMIDKVAKKLDCSRPMVYKLIYDGKLQSVRIGTRGKRVSVESLERFVDENRILPSDIYDDGMGDDLLQKGSIVMIPEDSINYNELIGDEFVVVQVVSKGAYIKRWDEPGKGMFLPHGEFFIKHDTNVEIHGE